MPRALAYFAWCIVWAVLIYSRVASLNWLSQWVIPLFVLSMAIRVRGQLKLRLALLFCLTGDVFINLTPWSSMCVPSFAVAHVLLALHFRSRSRGLAWKWFLPGAILSGFFLLAVHNQIMDAAHWIVLVAYLSVLNTMLAMGLNGWKQPRIEMGMDGCTLFGAGLFFVTDLLVIAQFLTGNSAFALGIWLCYPPALYILSSMEENRNDNTAHS